jgi:hypothetical protein
MLPIRFRETTTFFNKESQASKLLSADVSICFYIKLLCEIYATSDEIPCFHRIRCVITLFLNSRLSANSLVCNLSVSHILIISCHLCPGLSSGLIVCILLDYAMRLLKEVIASLHSREAITSLYYIIIHKHIIYFLYYITIHKHIIIILKHNYNNKQSPNMTCFDLYRLCQQQLTSKHNKILSVSLHYSKLNTTHTGRNMSYKIMYCCNYYGYI